MKRREFLAGVDYRAKDFEREAGTRDAAKNHPRMDVASEGQATDRRTGQALRQEGDGANSVQWRSVRADNEVADPPHWQAVTLEHTFDFKIGVRQRELRKLG